MEKKAESRWGSGFMKYLSRDLKEVNPGATCFSEANLLYMKNFYRIYQPFIAPQVVGQITQQLAEQMDNINTLQYGEQFTQQAVEQKENAITPQLGEQIRNDMISISWGHHKVLIDKYPKQPEKALFFVHQTVDSETIQKGSETIQEDTKTIQKDSETIQKALSKVSKKTECTQKDMVFEPREQDFWCFVVLKLLNPK
ncbi:MAG: hypothetical protein IJR02_08650 [Bacteroidaceae bacterium]|nr:hypothetical protein [Bacteroidaceae bacterium]